MHPELRDGIEAIALNRPSCGGRRSVLERTQDKLQERARGRSRHHSREAQLEAALRANAALRVQAERLIAPMSPRGPTEQPSLMSLSPSSRALGWHVTCISEGCSSTYLPGAWPRSVFFPSLGGVFSFTPYARPVSYRSVSLRIARIGGRAWLGLPYRRYAAREGRRRAGRSGGPPGAARGRRNGVGLTDLPTSERGGFWAALFVVWLTSQPVSCAQIAAIRQRRQRANRP
jgi:hypothetical protein